MKLAFGMALDISVSSETLPSWPASRACSTPSFHTFSSQEPREIVGDCTCRPVSSNVKPAKRFQAQCCFSYPR